MEYPMRFELTGEGLSSLLTITPAEASERMIGFSNLASFLIRRGTRPYEWGIQWDSNSLMKAS